MTDKTEREKILSAMRDELPPYFRIKEQKILSEKTVYNLISQGRGPAITAVGGKNFLERESFMNWLAQRGGALRKPGRQRSKKPTVE
jgi:hypothetical protein